MGLVGKGKLIRSSPSTRMRKMRPNVAILETKLADPLIYLD